MILKYYNIIKSLLPHKVKLFICSIIQLPYLIIWRLNVLINFIRLKLVILSHKKINVYFYALNVSMWKYDGLYNLMSKNNLFKPVCVIIPWKNKTHEECIIDSNNLELYFKGKNYNYIKLYSDKGYLSFDEVEPDILFYPQPYGQLFPDNLSYESFPNSLLCYIPYAMRSIGFDWAYNTNYQNKAWKLFYETNFHKSLAKRYCLYGSKNVVVTGATVYDNFLNMSYRPNDIWKKQDRLKKKVIWAPHHSVENNSWLDYSMFFEICDIMPRIAEKYFDKIQFCFKPHPMLITKLYNIWGKEKTDSYYNLWVNMPNTQYENGEYIDLFMTSDAMIHDCDSFRFEYLITGKPVAYVKKEKYKSAPVGISKIAFDLHYNANSEQKIVDFLENIVLNGNDPLYEKRKEFKHKYLIPPNGKTASENIYEDICKSLGIKNG